MKYIYPHMGMGDFLICNGLIRKLIKTQEEYSIFVHKKNYESVDFMFKDLKNIKYIIGNEDYTPKDNFVINYIKSNNINVENLIRITLDRDIISKSFDENFYLSKSIPFNYRWDNFKCERDYESEKKLYEKMDLNGVDYVFVHDDSSRGYNIKNDYLKNKKVIRPVIGFTNNIFDYLTIIENANEIHCMDSSFRMMIDSYPMDKNLFFHTYCRPNRDFAQSKNKWNLID